MIFRDSFVQLAEVTWIQSFFWRRYWIIFALSLCRIKFQVYKVLLGFYLLLIVDNFLLQVICKKCHLKILPFCSWKTLLFPFTIDHSQFESLERKIENFFAGRVRNARETINLISCVRQGMVEKWLAEVEDNMIISVKQVMFKSYQAYAETPRKRWVLDWPGQVVLCISQTYWTSEVTEAIEEGSLAVSLLLLQVAFVLLYFLSLRYCCCIQ